MTHKPGFQQALATFTRRWHLLEQSLGAKGGLVIDFDMASRDLFENNVQPYESRESALAALDDVRTQVETKPGIHNRAFLQQHLRGSDAYLRALMGERASFPA